MRPNLAVLAASSLAAGAALPAAATAAAPPVKPDPAYEACLQEQSANPNVDCVSAQVTGWPYDPRVLMRMAPAKRRNLRRTVRVTWSLGHCGGIRGAAWNFGVRFVEPYTGVSTPAEEADGTPRYLYNGTTRLQSKSFSLKPGVYAVDMGVLSHSGTDDGTCDYDVRSEPFRVSLFH
jgi:hypothetical protein